MEFWKKLTKSQSVTDQEKLDETRYRTEGECLREGVYLKKKVSGSETSFEYRDGDRVAWLAAGKRTEVAGEKVILLWSDNWCSIGDEREPITEEIRKQIRKDLRKSVQGPFVDRCAPRI
jgi:hypothetical protein